MWHPLSIRRAFRSVNFLAHLQSKGELLSSHVVRVPSVKHYVVPASPPVYMWISQRSTNKTLLSEKKKQANRFITEESI